jgi:Acidobacterial duplicated orphan permease
VSPSRRTAAALYRYLRFFGADVDADVDDELHFHLDERIAEYERQGFSRANAERLARERLGDLDAVARELRAHDRRRLRRVGWSERLATLRQNLLHAMRTLGRARGWTLSVVLTLAIGIGFATAVYTIADALLIRPLPVHAPERVVVLWGTTPDGRTDHVPLLYRDALEYARRTQTLEQVAFFSSGGAQPLPVDLDAGIVRLRRSLVSGNYFDLLGTAPVLGRSLRPQDDVRGAAPTAVLSYSAWQRFFGGDPKVIGRRIILHWNGVPCTIVGVMPRALDYPQGVDFWSPVVPNSGPLGDQPIYAELNVIGRLRSHASVVDARRELTRFFATTRFDSWKVRAVARSLTDDVLGNVGPAVLAFSGAAALLLLITCINVANLLLVRGLSRIRELAVRSALGAGRARLVNQLLIEGTLLAIGGGIAGALLAVAAVKGFIGVAPPDTPRLAEIHVGISTIVVATAVTTLAMLLFAVAPSLASSRIDVPEALRSGTRQSGSSRRFRRGSQALVVAQMALAVLVLCVAGLVGRSLLSLARVPVALDPERLLVVELAFPKSFMDKPVAPTVDQLVEGLSATPGVRGVAPVFTPPFAAVGGIFGRIPAEGQTADEESRNPPVDYELETPGALATLGVPIVRGRDFTGADRNGSLPVAIVSEAFARLYWPGENPIGKRLVRGKNDLLTVIGVAGDTHYRNLRKPRPRVYEPLRQSQFPFAPTTLVIATVGKPASLVPQLRRIVAEVAPGVAVASAATLETYIGGALAQPRMNALLLGLFAAAAILLAAVGLFGVMATSVRLRARELSVRLAIGATPNQLRAAVMSQALTIAVAGLAIGLAASLATTRALSSLLFGISPTDPVTLGLTSLLLLTVAVLAAYIPAARAQRMDPVVALRGDG